MYNESYDVVRETLDSLTRSRYPLDRLIVALATEERAMEAGCRRRGSGEKIEEEFKDKFFRFLTTRHPADIAGELAGKVQRRLGGQRSEAARHRSAGAGLRENNRFRF